MRQFLALGLFFLAAQSFAQEAPAPFKPASKSGACVKITGAGSGSGSPCVPLNEVRGTLKDAIQSMNSAGSRAANGEVLSQRSAAGTALYRAQSLGLAGKSVTKPYYGAQ